MVTKAVVLELETCESITDPTTQQPATSLSFNVGFATPSEQLTILQINPVILASDTSAVIRQKIIDAIKAKALSDLSLVIANEDMIIPSYTTGLSTPESQILSTEFTDVGTSEAIDLSLNPLSVFSLHVEGVDGTPVAWTAHLEGSLDNDHWSSLLEHTQLIGNGKLISSGGNRDPCLFIRTHVESLNLGLSATALKVIVLGVK